MSKDKETGYVGVMTSLFTSCDVWSDVLGKNNFSSILTLPAAGDYRGNQREDSNVYYRQFEEHDYAQKISMNTSVEEYKSRADKLLAHLPHPSDDVTPLPRIPALQQPITVLKSDDVTIIARSPRKEDLAEIYAHVEVAASK